MVRDAGGRKRWQGCLAQSDKEALDYLVEKYLYSRRVEAVRYCLRAQALRDQGFGPRYKALGRKLLETVTPLKHGRGAKVRDGHDNLPNMDRWCCWMYPEHLEHAHAIRSYWGLAKVAEAVRLAIRVQAELEGFRPDGGW